VGTSFDSLTHSCSCIFGNAHSEAYVTSSSEIHCTVPNRRTVELVSLQLNCGEEYDSLQFQYLPELNLDAYEIANDYVRIHMIDGEQHLVTFKKNDYPSTYLSCVFLDESGNVLLSTLQVVDEEFRCDIPSDMSTLSEMIISLRWDRKHYYFRDTLKLDQILPCVKSILPSVGSTLGGTPVLIQGTNFEDADSLRCAFGLSPDTYVSSFSSIYHYTNCSYTYIHTQQVQL